MADRRRQVILLLGSRHDGVYLPPGSLITPAGLVPAEREPCAACGGVLLRDDFGKEIRRRKGRGYVLDRFKRRQPCTSCGEVGWIARDPMDAQQVRVGSSTTTSTARPRATVRCDACNGEGVRGHQRCDRCEGAGRRDLHVFDLHVDTRDVDERDPMTAAIEARAESGSYRELDRALEMLRSADAIAWLQLLACVDEQRIPTVGDPHQVAFERGLRFVVDRMPDPIKVPPGVAANARLLAEHRTRARGRGPGKLATRQRDAEIHRHQRDGRSPQWIAGEYGLHVSTVYAIVNRRAAL